MKGNFLHLTGISTDKNAGKFYKDILKGRVGINDFTLNPAGYDKLKLSVLPYLLKLEGKSFTIVADYINGGAFLQSDKVIGNRYGCLICSYQKNNSDMYPKSVLAVNSVDEITIKGSSEKVLCIFSKKFDSLEQYENLLFIQQNIDINQLLKKK